MKIESIKDYPGLDYEWAELIIEALEMGLSEKDIRKFFAESKQKVKVYTK